MILMSGLLVWDIWLAMNQTEGDTISAVVHRYGTQSWFVLVGIGVLLGHFFWNMQDGRLTIDEWKDYTEEHSGELSSVTDTEAITDKD